MSSTPRTVDEQLERMASASERQADALEGLLEAIQGIQFPDPCIASADEEKADGPNEDEPEAADVAEQASEEAAEETHSEPEAAAEDETTGAEEATDDEPDPLGDGDGAADVDVIAVPEDLKVEDVRNMARDLMESKGKPEVFKVLAEVGDGYKAVGEIKSDDLEDAYVKMATALRA